jgi:hypothetical protein
MHRNTKLWIIAVLALGVGMAFSINNNYVYLSLLLTNTEKYPTGLPLENMVIYQFDPQTVLISLDQGKTDVFFSAQKNPLYDDVQPLAPISSFAWSQEDSLRVANALHQLIWKEPLEQWHLYSLGFTIPQCNDISRINGAGFQFYKRQPQWYYLVHDINLDLQYGYIYAGDHDGHYTGRWKDIGLANSKVNTFDKALQIAEENGGKNARLALNGNQKCYISIQYPIGTYVPSKWVWDITYRITDRTSSIFKILIDPFTSDYDILAGN